jgi:hypothetical protein
MFLAAVINIVTICIGVFLVWTWVAFISEVISRRTGRKSAVPHPDKVLLARVCQRQFDAIESEKSKKPIATRIAVDEDSLRLVAQIEMFLPILPALVDIVAHGL